MSSELFFKFILLVTLFSFSGCKIRENNMELPCNNNAYSVGSIVLRGFGYGSDSSLHIAKQKALLRAKNELAGLISSKISSDNKLRVIEITGNDKDKVSEIFSSESSVFVNQNLKLIKKNCEIVKKDRKGVYHVYMSVVPTSSNI